MTVRTLYDNLLIELNKVEAPSLLLEDFVYFANKAVQQYTNKRYNQYDMTQQTTDDLSALKRTTTLDIYLDTIGKTVPSEDADFTCNLPEDYMHLLNCIVVFKKVKSDDWKGCDSKSSKEKVKSMARRLTSDMYPSIIRNAYFKPSYKCPYYFITNHPISENSEDSITNKMEIRCGSTKKYSPETVFIDYLKVPSTLGLTYEQLETIEDSSQVLEFPEYVCYEIQNELVKLVLENIGDPRLQTNIPINQSIAETSINNNK